MTILTDRQIAERCGGENPMICPFVSQSIREVFLEEGSDLKRKIMSYGVSSFGYDVRLRTDSIQIFNKDYKGILDPKRPDPACMLDAEILTDEDGAKYVILPPNNYMLAPTVEEFHIPADVMVICLGKSTYARMASICNTTPIEAGFVGNVVIEIANGTPLPCKIYLDEGIAQFLFFRGDEDCSVSYAQRDGKYMYQGMNGAAALTPSRV